MKQLIVLCLAIILFGCDSSTSISASEEKNSANDAPKTQSENDVSKTQADIEALYVNTCRVCHDAGIAGAPKIGDPLAWQAREAKGMDTLVMSVRNGLGAMPPGGLCPQCSDDDLKALIDYIINPN